MVSRLLVLSVIALAGLAAACSGDDDDAAPEIGCSGGVYDVTVTLPMFAEFACAVGEDNVNVSALLPLDGDPHTYTPPEEDVELVTRAKLILYNGLDLDAPIEDYIRAHGRGSAQIIAFARSVTSPTAEQPSIEEPRISAAEAGDNPYLWLDPDLARSYVDATRDSLEIIDPEHIADYRAAAADYFARIDTMRQEFLEVVVGVPAENLKLVTLHNSVEHLARRFGFEVVGYLTEPGHQPTPEEIQDLADVVRESGVPAVFAEVGYDAGPMQEVADQADVELCYLYTDRGDADAYAYLDIMRANMGEIQRCLGGG
jgi:ABC-type Zn uptake system ZnuABC Zn-binding protein ZnuA